MPTVRILAEDMSQPSFQGQQVRAVGKLVNVLEGSVELQLAGAEGHPAATVVCPNSAHKYSRETMGKGCYEVIGTLSNGQISEMSTVYMGETLDMDMYAQMVTLTHSFPDIF